MKGGNLALIALTGCADDVLDPQDIREAKIHSEPLEAARHRRCRGFHLPLCIDGRQPLRQIPFACRFSGTANRAKRDTKDEMGGVIGRIRGARLPAATTRRPTRHRPASRHSQD